HYLKRFIQSLRGKEGAQRRVSIDNALPRLFKSRDIDVSVHHPGEDLDLHRRAGSIAVVKQDALLHRGERIDILDVFELHFERSEITMDRPLVSSGIFQ